MSVVYNYDDIICDMKSKLQTCHELAGKNLIRTKQCRVAQQATKVKMPVFKIGDNVLLRNESAKKLEPLLAGPYTILEIDYKG
jgi:hypothetical protein